MIGSVDTDLYRSTISKKFQPLEEMTNSASTYSQALVTGASSGLGAAFAERYRV
jgi:hypothetical protein